MLRQVFNEMGGAGPSTLPGRLVVRIHARPHARFTRQGDRLLYRQSISLLQVSHGCPS